MKLSELSVDTHVLGIEPSGPVKVLYVKLAGTEFADVTYELLSGQVLKKTLFRADEEKLSVASTTRQWPFDAKAESFKLAAEATRIKLAHLFDPMMAVHTSDVLPLPHQISAVYEAMLPKQPLRFVLADDPGAGKTIMAGLLIRELMLRGDLERCLIITPGSLIEQWQTELSEKFGLRFDMLTNALVESTATGNPFVEHPLLLARLDQLTRKVEWHPKLLAESANWDLVIVDEAHKMAAHYGFGNELKTTRRYDLGREIGHPARTRNFLLMTATPHNGHEEDFQAWLALVDADRFHGKAREKAEAVELKDIMRRLVKEDLLKFDGTRLFPPRYAETIAYTLSPAEKALYEDVTDYVRHEMGRADALEGKKKGMVGFALTILQRRVASSPHAIAESLRRRRERLELRLKELKTPSQAARRPAWEELDADDLEDDLPADELEEIEDELVDDATAARTIPELEAELVSLRALEKQAKDVLRSGVDKKWDELSKLLQSNAKEMYLPNGRRRKMLIFTEHKDTLDYLRKNIARVLGASAVIEIHGGTRREDRLKAQEEFRQNPDVLVLVATDAAGEGVNLQVTNLMLNYDLPWNPNRIEQRFGRIHRIGQNEACHLWNLVAIETREGEVFHRLFTKLDEERKALGGKVFDILGQSFADHALKDLIIKAIRFGDQKSAHKDVIEKVEGALDRKHLQDILDKNALTADIFSQERLYAVKEQMERAEAKKLQPFYLRRFVIEALGRHGGELKEREPGRYEIKHVPAIVRRRHAAEGGRRPVLERYERVTFDRELMRPLHKPVADLVHPAHPLMSALIDVVLTEEQKSLHAGTVLVDPTDPGTTPRLMFMIDHGVREGTAMTRLASRRMQFVEIDSTGTARHAGSAPYLSYEAAGPEHQELVARVLAEPWLAQDLSSLALSWASEHLVKEHFDEVRVQRQAVVKKTLAAVHERLTREVNHWSRRATELAAEVKAGKQPRIQPENARKRADELKARLAARTRELEAQLELSSNPPIVAGCALIIPEGLIQASEGKAPPVEADAEMRRRIELLAMKAVIDAETKLGNSVKDVSAAKCGWDVTSMTPAGESRHIEVKGRHVDGDTVIVTANEVLEALNQGEKFILAIVRIDGDKLDGPHYIRAPFVKELEGSVVSVAHSLKDLLKRAKAPGLA